MGDWLPPVGTLVTDALVKKLNTDKIVASEVAATIAGVTSANLAAYLMDLSASVVKGSLMPEKFVVAVKAAGLSGPEVQSVLADTIWFMSVALEDKLEGADKLVPKEGRARLVEMTREAMQAAVTTDRLLLERLETDFLSALGLLGPTSPFGDVDVAGFHKKMIRVNTTMVYKQNKFNLLREESEGYAKLITTLNRFGADAISEASAAEEIKTVQSLIGYFDLDPNRVFDLLLDCYEQQPQNDAFLKLMPLFRTSNMAHIFGFKMQYYQDEAVQKEVKGTPASLYKLAATCIAAGWIDLDMLYPHMHPEDKDAFKARKESVEARIKAANQIGKINLAETKDNPGNKDKNEPEPEEFAMTEEAPDKENQKLHLVLGFLDIGAWAHAKALLERLAPLEPAGTEAVGAALRALLSKVVQGEASKLVGAAAEGKDVEMSQAGGAAPGVLPAVAFELITALGVWIYKDIRVFTRVVRALKAHLEATGVQGQKGATSAQVEGALEASILPAMTLIPANPAAVNEVWALMSLLPYVTRFRLYGVLQERMNGPNPVLVAAGIKTVVETKKIMRRLSKENVKEFGRKLGKISHANPLTVFNTLLSQIEVYNNMIIPVVDALKYITPLGYDALTYCVVLFLGGRGQLAKLKQDGMNVSLWLTSLANFCGHLTRKHAGVELTALLQLLVHQLKDSQSIDLLVLKEVIARMTGMEIMPDMSNEQLEAMAGGEILRSEAVSYSAFQVAGSAKSLVKNTQRLKDALLVGEEADQLLVPLLVLIAQLRTSIVFNTQTEHLKLIGNLYDNCHEALVQYNEFVDNAVVDVEEFVRLMPPLSVLTHEYKLEPEVVFLIYRPVLRTLATTVIPRQPEEGATKQIEARKALAVNFANGKMKHTWDELLQMCTSMLPERTWQSLSPELYLTFWTLSLSDLHCPVERYEAEIKRQKSQATTVDRQISDAARQGGDPRGDPKLRKERDRLLGQAEKLTKELEAQKKHVAQVKARLRKEKDTWLSRDTMSIEMRKETMVQLLQTCILPRVMFTYADASYCAKFVHELHKMDTPYISTLQYYDRVLKDLSQLVFCCTEYEAARMGKFISETLELLDYWKSSPEVYAEECLARAGFATTFTDPGSKRASYEEFVRVSFRWQNKMTKSIGICLDSDEYMHIRNALIVLTKIVKVFPRIIKHAVHIEKRVAKIRDKDSREDLQTVAKSYYAQLMSQKANWVTEEQYGGKDGAGAGAEKASTSERAKGGGDAEDGGAARGSRSGREDAREAKEESKSKRVKSSEDLPERGLGGGGSSEGGERAEADTKEKDGRGERDKGGGRGDRDGKRDSAKKESKKEPEERRERREEKMHPAEKMMKDDKPRRDAGETGKRRREEEEPREGKPRPEEPKAEKEEASKRGVKEEAKRRKVDRSEGETGTPPSDRRGSGGEKPREKVSRSFRR